MKILGEFWNAGIAAETLYNDNPKSNRQMEYAMDNGIPLILFIGDDELEKGIVKIKILNEQREVAK